MKTRSFALLLGIIFLVIGALGFVPALRTPIEGVDPAVAGSAGNQFGLFPVNWLHNLVHLAFGVWGIAVHRSYSGARGFAQTTAIVYALLTVMGLIPGLNTVFGLIPIHGNDVWLHALLAIASAYFGFFAREDASERDRYTSTAM